MTAIPRTLRRLALGAAVLSFFTFAAAAQENVVHVYNWVDYIGENTIAEFEAETGIKVIYDTYDASETAEAKLLAGRSGYDVVLHSGSKIPEFVAAGIFQPLDKSKLPHWKHLDPDILKVLDGWDPGNAYGVPYMWGTTGITYNMEMVTERLGENAPLDTLDIIMKPEYAAKVADCGISVLESPRDVIPMILSYLGKDPNSSDPADYDAVVEAFLPVRQYIKTFDSSNYLNALPNKEVCVVNNWSGDYATAASRAEEAGIEIELAYFVPKTGSPAWFDVWVIPSDAPNVENAYKFIDFLLRPKVIADATNFTYYANANKDAAEFVDPAILADPAIYPDAELMSRLWTNKVLDRAADRARVRAWSRMKTGQ
ncbi:putrescine transport system substrate-binding protein [Tepidamorphus gemmatus]|uniref:Putrescine-binding periplasmic protein n=1 Tax=Tepidamorphus gemmatus TaxID=747076 RepID=A0A4V2UZA9_9HYPH|nr:polyamine ABC transporter substrate-binding protein [Tepidamorphus gemmatus]TCT10598.1 putrescine transport system substrate-binding protein [Tepidamorphus gemmatus]